MEKAIQQSKSIFLNIITYKRDGFCSEKYSAYIHSSGKIDKPLQEMYYRVDLLNHLKKIQLTVRESQRTLKFTIFRHIEVV